MNAWIMLSSMTVSFEHLRLGELEEVKHIADAIETIPFVEACRSVVNIFNELSLTAFAPVKMDINGNIYKIQQKYLSNPELHICLQASW